MAFMKIHHLALLPLLAGTSVFAQTPSDDLCGEYSSNKVEETGVGGTPDPSGNPLSLVTPWSHYLNPAHPGVASFLGVPTCPPLPTSCEPGLGRQTFGETRVDQYLLGPWTGAVPVECFDSGWSGKTWSVPKDPYPGTGTTNWTYRRRSVTLPSGAYVTVFRPEEPPGPSSLCSEYQRDAVFYPQGYQGGNYEVARAPAGWKDENGDDVYDNLDTPFGYEIQAASVPTYIADTARVTYVRYGSLEYEALQMGMTLVFVQASLGGRPTFTHLAQMIEAATWLDSLRYENVAGAPVLHRKVITGGSYGGVVSMLSALYFPWVFGGAISRSHASDLHMNFAWGPVEEFYDDLLLGNYRDPLVDASDHQQPIALEQITSSRRGYTPNVQALVPGIEDNGVDLAGLGLLCDDLENPPFLPPLYVPLLLVGGDEDPITYEFLAQDIQQIHRSITCSGATYEGSVEVRRVPMQGHGTDDSVVFHAWNEGARLLHGFMSQLDARPCPPLCAACVTPTGKPLWHSKIPAGVAQTSTRPRDEFLKVGGITEVVAPGVSVSVLGDDTASSWKRLRAPAGLGLGQNMIAANVDAEGSMEVVAADTLGNLLKLRLVADAAQPSLVRLETLWSVRTSDYLGPTEIALDSSSASDKKAVCLHKTGRVSVIPLASDTAPTPTVLFELGYGINSPVTSSSRGSFFRSLRAVPGLASTYSAVDDEGDLIRFSTGTTPSLQADRFLEGGAAPVLPIASQTPGERFLFASAHGNLKRIPNVNSSSSVPVLSPHVFAYCPVLLDLGAAVGQVRFIGLGAAESFAFELILFRTDLSVVGYAVSDPSNTTTFQPRNWDGLVYAGTNSGAMRLVGFSGASNDSLGTSEIDAFEVSASAALTRVGQATVMPSPVTSVRACPVTLSAKTSDGTTFTVKWIATLETGQVALLGELFSTSAVPKVILGRPLTSAFALRRDPNSSLAMLLGPQKRSWSLSMLSDTAPISELTQSQYLNKNLDVNAAGYPPVRGFYSNGQDCYGLSDGGDADGVFGTNLYDPTIALDALRLRVFNLSTMIQAWQSEPIVFQGSVGTANSIGHILTAFGNSAKWADLDGDLDSDLVAGTYGGKVMWWKREAGTGFVLSTDAKGSLSDRGSSIIGLGAAELDDTPSNGAELLVGVGLLQDDAYAHLFQSKGALLVVDKAAAGDSLVTLATEVTEPGVNGIHHFAMQHTAVGSQHDDDWIVIGTALGRIHVYHYDPTRSPALEAVYHSRCFAPMAGAYNSIQSITKSVDTAMGKFVQRIVFATSGGIYGIDLTLPLDYYTGG